MNSQIVLLAGSWSVLVAAYVILFIYRKQVERNEDDSIHVLADNRVLATQQSIAQKMNVLERWSKIVGITVVVYGLVVAAAYIYSVWQSNLNVS